MSGVPNTVECVDDLLILLAVMRINNLTYFRSTFMIKITANVREIRGSWYLNEMMEIVIGKAYEALSVE